MAIDYTASNGNPADPRSLHYVDPAGVVLNDYARAMSGIGRVLEFYGKTTVISFFCLWNSLSTVMQGPETELSARLHLWRDVFFLQYREISFQFSVHIFCT